MTRQFLATFTIVLWLFASLPGIPWVGPIYASSEAMPPGTSFNFSYAKQNPRVPTVFVHVPKNAKPGQMLQVLIALHGMGGHGATFAMPLIDISDRNNWLLVAPDLLYRDWRDPSQVRQDNVTIEPTLRQLIDDLPSRTGWDTNVRALAIGFSRGGQAAHRFALFYPEVVLAAATLSAGTYTLPYQTWKTGERETLLPLPYGVGDLDTGIGHPFDLETLQGVKFWVGVGAQDNVAAESPQQWDPYLGRGRVERARAFVDAMQSVGVTTTFEVFPGVSHAVTPEMLASASRFLQAVQAGDPVLTMASY